MWGKAILLGILGFSAGCIAAAGLVALIIGLGVVSDLADRTHTGKYVCLYEDFLALGGGLANAAWIYKSVPRLGVGALCIFGVFAGIFSGCWSMAVAEVLNIFPIFFKKFKLEKSIPVITFFIALAKGVGNLLFFYKRW